jgi:hypothetical protein
LEFRFAFLSGVGMMTLKPKPETRNPIESMSAREGQRERDVIRRALLEGKLRRQGLRRPGFGGLGLEVSREGEQERDVICRALVGSTGLGFRVEVGA